MSRQHKSRNHKKQHNRNRDKNDCKHKTKKHLIRSSSSSNGDSSSISYTRKNKCKDNKQVIKAVIPRILIGGNDVNNLVKIQTNVQALDYITPLDGDSNIHDPDSVINMYLDLSEVEEVKNIDHIDLDMHVTTETTENIVFNMYLSQTVCVETIIDGEPQIVKQSQRYLYQGHKYTLDGRKWSQLGERWDRPRNLGILSATNLDDDAELVPPVLQISLLGVIGKLIVDQTIQLHVEYSI